MRCTDCHHRTKSFYIDYHHPGVDVCERCVVAWRERYPGDFWWGMETRREVPNVKVVLLGTYVVCAAILCLVLLAGHL